MAIVAVAATLTLILQILPLSLAATVSGTCNVAFSKPTEAHRTCGIVTPESYYSASQMDLSPRYRRLSVCDAKNATLAHNASSLVDEDLSTWWQTTASVDVANITISLTGPAFKNYYAESIAIHFGEYFPPKQMAIYKSNDSGITFTPWHYFVSSDKDNECEQTFKMPHSTNAPGDSNRVLCTSYIGGFAFITNQTIEWKVWGGRASNLKNPSEVLLGFMNVTDVRIEFFTLPRLFDVLAVRWHHYAVREVKVHSFCSCNGQGSGCEYNETTKDNQCTCQAGTCGYYCDRCCPAYNQYPWKQGSLGPLLVDPTSACHACNCHDHSSVCVYNETVEQKRASMDINGNYNGGGVCQDCQHNTRGINCEKCEPLYYRPVNRSINAVNACEACDCSVAGSKNHTLPGVLHLDCLREYNESRAKSSMRIGDCFCKNNTMSRRCDSCKPRHFNLTAENPQGCQVCECNTAGTVNGSNLCHPDEVGQCPCKLNVHGVPCNTCNNTFYGLSRDDPNGCRPCMCDYGGSSNSVCNKTDGQCACLPNIEGRQCERPKDDYYYPELHFMSGPLTRHSQSNSWTTTFGITAGVNSTSGLYTLLLSYQSTTQQTAIITVTSPEGTISQPVALPICNQTCHLNLTVFGERKLTGSVTVNVSGISSDFKGVRVVALPKEFYEGSVLADRLGVFAANCSVLNNDVKLGSSSEQICKQGVFTLTTDYLGKALACACDSVGSVNSTCAKYGGQCHCRPGVTGRTCNECEPQFYNFTNTGCSACSCAADHKVCNATTGQCKCPLKTVGRMCDACNANFWGWNTTNGCQACHCDGTGSSDLQCNLTTGICSCQPGVTHAKCSECEDGYKNFSSAGCTACGCDEKGSEHSVCNKTSGQCPCKNNTISLTCNQCGSGTFYLTKANLNGCMDCICSGITTNCTSTTQYTDQRSIAIGLWVLGEENSTATIETREFIMNGSAMVMLTGNVSGSQDLYWKAHANFTKDSLVDAYGGNLTFMLHMTKLKGGTVNTNVKVILKGSNGVAIERILSAVPVNQPTTMTVLLKETSWVYAGSSTPVSRAHFMLVLAKPRDILVTASLYSVGNGYYNTNFGGIVVSGVRTSPAGNRAFDVEQCNCGPEYTGLSCERCAPGHHRVNESGDPFFGKCVACNCNGHSGDCYPSTGICYNCNHNTTGDHCELCSDSYYGNATDGTLGDCNKCPCDGLKTKTPLCKDVAGSPVCANCSVGYEGSTCDSCHLRYFGLPLTTGGNCSLCQCNNNTDICNTRSGECTNCQYNTTGFHCERCENATYGDATKQQCRDCLCDGIGAHHNVCDYRTGQCACKPNVNDRNCSRCQEFSYGFNASGCTQCGCNKHGSSDLQCNETGVCQCYNHTLGEKCDTCEWGFFGLPNQPCEVCSCNVTGSYNHTQCDRVTGQCHCKPGVTGTQCDKCSTQHVNFTETGCDECPMCTRLGLQGTINETNLILQAADNKAREVDKLKVLKPELEKLVDRIKTTKLLITEFDTRIESVSNGLKLMKSNTLNNSVTDLQKQISLLTTNATALKLNTSQQLTRVDTIHNSTQHARDLVNSVNAEAQAIQTQLNNLKISADAMLASYGFLNKTYSTELARATQELANAEAAYSLADTARNSTVYQRAKFDNLNSNITRDRDSFYTREREFKTIASRAQEVTRITSHVHDVVNQTQELITQGNSVIAQARQLLREASGLLVTSWSDVAHGQQAYESTEKVVKGGVQGLEELLRTLNTSLTPTEALLLAANLTVNVNGTQHAANLTDEALLRKNAFEAIRDHGRLAVEAIRQYESVVKLVNQSLEASRKVNESLEEIMVYLRNFTATFSAMEQQAQSCYNKSKDLLDITRARNIDIAGYQTNLTAANQTFKAATLIGRKAQEYHNLLLSRSTLLIAMSEPGQKHSVIKDSAAAWTFATWAKDISNPLVTDAKTFQVEVARLDTSMAYINHSSEHSRQLTKKAFTNVQNTSATLPNVRSAVQKTQLQRNITSSLQEKLKVNMTRLREKLRQVKEKVAKIQHALSLKGNTSVEYTPTGRQVQATNFNDVALDFKADNNIGGPLFFYAEGNTDMHSSLALTLVYNQYVQFTFDLGSGPISITNWEVSVRQGKWYRVYASRYNKNGRLTVTDYSTNYSRTYESNTQQIVPRTKINFNTSSPLLIGGLPNDAMPNQTHRFFHGCIDNVVVNQEPLSLWKPLRVNGNRYACSKCLASASQPLFYNDNIPGTSFFGSPATYIKQTMGTFDISRYSKISFQFRTFLPTSSILNVLSNEGYVYGIYLNASRVTFYFKNGSIVYTVSSNNTAYNDGRWYHLTVKRALSNAELFITRVGSQDNDTTSMSLTSPLVLPTGTALVFGGKDPQSPFLSPVSVHFAGAIRNLSISSNASQSPVPRLLDDKALTQESSQVDFCGVLGDVDETIRFRGNSYAGVSPGVADMSSISIKFKTLQPSGLLVYSGDNHAGYYFYLALFHGNLFLVNTKTPNSYTPITTTMQTLNDGAYHTVTVTLFALGLRLDVDDGRIVRSVDLGTVPAGPAKLNGTLNVGGIKPGSTLPLSVPVVMPFVGEMKYIDVNGRHLNIFTGHSTDVSLAGGSPALTVLPTPLPTVPPPTLPPPTCGDAYPRLTLSKEPDAVNFGPNNYIAFTPSPKVLSFIKTQGLITLRFRSLSPNGVMFYGADSLTHPREFISVELVNGKIVYQFNAGAGLVQVKSTLNTYSLGGLWYELNVLRINQFGALLVKKDYDKSEGPDSTDPLVINTPIYMGGVPPGINTSLLMSGGVSFIGCMTSMLINSRNETVSLNPSVSDVTRNNATGWIGRDDSNSNVNDMSCYKVIQAQASFNGKGQILFRDNYTLPSTFDIKLRFRTIKRSGLLLVFTNRTGHGTVTLEQLEGQVVLTFASETANQTVMKWTDPSIPPAREYNASYHLCDNKFHEVRVQRNDGSVTLTVDKHDPLTSQIAQDFHITGKFYIGGVPDGSGSIFHGGFSKARLEGCVENLLLDTKKMELLRSPAIMEPGVTQGCRAPADNNKDREG